jgi:hypothetical protein
VTGRPPARWSFFGLASLAVMLVGSVLISGQVRQAAPGMSDAYISKVLGELKGVPRTARHRPRRPMAASAERGGTRGITVKDDRASSMAGAREAKHIPSA